MSYLMTWALRIDSHSVISVLYLLGPALYMPEECMLREQSRIGFIIRPIIKGCISIPFISPT